MNKYNKKSSFEHFGTVQKNPHWSWSAISEDMKLVAVTLWKDQIKYNDKGKPEWNTFGLPMDQNNELWRWHYGNRERIKHLKYSLEKLNGLFRVVIAVAKDIHAFPRKGKDFYPWEGIWMKIVELNEETGECRAVFHSRDNSSHVAKV